jgi:hypothetical protein
MATNLQNRTNAAYGIAVKAAVLFPLQIALPRPRLRWPVGQATPLDQEPVTQRQAGIAIQHFQSGCGRLSVQAGSGVWGGGGAGGQINRLL